MCPVRTRRGRDARPIRTGFRDARPIRTGFRDARPICTGLERDARPVSTGGAGHLFAGGVARVAEEVHARVEGGVEARAEQRALAEPERVRRAKRAPREEAEQLRGELRRAVLGRGAPGRRGGRDVRREAGGGPQHLSRRAAWSIEFGACKLNQSELDACTAGMRSRRCRGGSGGGVTGAGRARGVEGRGREYGVRDAACPICTE